MSFDSIASRWAELMLDGLFDGTLVLLVVMLLWLPLRRRAPAQLGYGLFLLVLVKLALPLAVPTPDVLARFSPSVLAGNAWASLHQAPAVVPAAVYLPEPPPERVSVVSVLLLAWAAIGLFLLARLVRQELGSRRRLRETTAPCDGQLAVAFDRLRDLIGVRRRVRLLLCDDDVGPATAGFVRPFVVVPRGLVERLDAKQLSWVLLHELAHIRRGDVLVAMLQRLVQIVFFFHPAVWFANRVIDEQREFACDEAALVVGRARGHELGETFLSVVEYSQAKTPAAALAMFDSKTVIRRRLMRMLEHRPASGRFNRLISAGFVGLVALFVIPDTVLEATPQDKKVGPEQELQKLQERLAELEKAKAKLQARLRELGRNVEAKKPTGNQRVEVDVSGKIDVNIRMAPDAKRKTATTLLRDYSALLDRAKTKTDAVRMARESYNKALRQLQSTRRYIERADNKFFDELGVDLSKDRAEQLRKSATEALRKNTEHGRRLFELYQKAGKENLEKAKKRLAEQSKRLDATRKLFETYELRKKNEAKDSKHDEAQRRFFERALKLQGENMKLDASKEGDGYYLHVDPLLEDGKLKLRTYLERVREAQREGERKKDDKRGKTDEAKPKRGTIGRLIYDDGRADFRGRTEGFSETGVVRVGNELLRYYDRLGRPVEKPKSPTGKRRL